MLQNFVNQSLDVPVLERLSDLRQEMKAQGLFGFIVPHADVYQGEYIAECDARLQWLTGFTGSAGLGVVLQSHAALFVDGRYALQAEKQINKSAFKIINTRSESNKKFIADWVAQHLATKTKKKLKMGYDPWLHSYSEINAFKKHFAEKIDLYPCANLIDKLWHDKPPSPNAPVIVYPDRFSGKSHKDKCHKVAQSIIQAECTAAVLTLPDSVCWLLNIRGNDIPYVPIVQAFAVVFSDAKVVLFINIEKVSDNVKKHFGLDVTILPIDAFPEFLTQRSLGAILVDKLTVPSVVPPLIEQAGGHVVYGHDPCVLPKACKNPVEIKGMRSAHQRDACAVIECLAWLDEKINHNEMITEIEIVQSLEHYRQATGVLMDISFETICGTGENAAIIHYCVTTDSNRTVQLGDLILLDSGGQYQDGTTDITRTVPISPVGDKQKRCYTRVLQGLIALSSAVWPQGLSGAHLDALVRSPLWADGLDYEHGSGHGVGCYLSVHEGPQRISSNSHVPLKAGMVVSNEPGYYEPNEFGIRIENLLLVKAARKLYATNPKPMLCFETLTKVPINTTLILPDFLSKKERNWINNYHSGIARSLMPHLSTTAQFWLEMATKPIR